MFVASAHFETAFLISQHCDKSEIMMVMADTGVLVIMLKIVLGVYFANLDISADKYNFASIQ